jgi:uncharacterized damage-inducible protein DinB
MQHLPSSFFCRIHRLLEAPSKVICAQSTKPMIWCTALALLALNLSPATVAHAQISADLPNPIAEPNPLTATLSIFRKNMQDKITKSANAMPESKYSYRPTPDVRSFAEILTHIADISYFLCSNAKGVPSPPQSTKTSKAEIVAYLKGSFDFCDSVYSEYSDTNLNAPADFFGHKTNKMFILTQVGNHDALHYGNLVTYMRLNGLEPSGGWF